MFYLAQTLDLIGELEPALAMYQQRIDAGGWRAEVFEAHMRRVCSLGFRVHTSGAHHLSGTAAAVVLPCLSVPADLLFG